MLTGTQRNAKFQPEISPHFNKIYTQRLEFIHQYVDQFIRGLYFQKCPRSRVMYLGASLARLCPSGSLRRRPDWAAVLSLAHSRLTCDNPSVVNRNFSYNNRTLHRHKLLQQSQQSLLIPPVRSIKFASRLVDSSPIQLQPFLKLSRLDKPIGSWLLFWPCGWATCLATQVG